MGKINIIINIASFRSLLCAVFFRPALLAPLLALVYWAHGRSCIEDRSKAMLHCAVVVISQGDAGLPTLAQVAK